MAVKEAHAGTVLTIDLDAIRDNYRLLRAKAGRAACAGVVKADAYGLGAKRIAHVRFDAAGQKKLLIKIAPIVKL